jgi:hypothetical protein
MECLVMIYEVVVILSGCSVGDPILPVSLSLSFPYRYPNIYHLRSWVHLRLLLAIDTHKHVH